MSNALIPQPVHDAIGEWIYSTALLRPWRAESNLPRPDLPYVGFEFRSFQAISSPHEEDIASSIVSAVFTVIADVGAYLVLLINGARVEFKRTIETLAEIAALATLKINSLARGRCTAVAIGAVITVLPITAGDLVDAQTIEGATLVLTENGPAYHVEQNVYRAAVRVQLHGLPYGADSGTLGDGTDLQTVAVRMREALSKPAAKTLFEAAWARIIDAPGVTIAIASATVSGKRETRCTLDLTLGVTIRTCSPSASIVEVSIADPLIEPPSDDDPLPLLGIE